MSPFISLHEHFVVPQENLMKIVSDYGKFQTFTSLLQV